MSTDDDVPAICCFPDQNRRLHTVLLDAGDHTRQASPGIEGEMFLVIWIPLQKLQWKDLCDGGTGFRLFSGLDREIDHIGKCLELDFWLSILNPHLPSAPSKNLRMRQPQDF